MWAKLSRALEGKEAAGETPRRRRSGSIASSSSARKHPEGYIPSSTSFASSSKSAYTATAAPSLARSYATASTEALRHEEPRLIRTESVQDRREHDHREQRSSSHDRRKERRRDRSRSRSRDRKRDHHQHRTGSRETDERRYQTEDRSKKRDGTDRGLSRSVTEQELPERSGRGPETIGSLTNRTGPRQSDSSPDQDIRVPGVSPYQTPVQTSALVTDQFPGQFPAQTSAPYRPPLSISEGGPGLAADYYGDQGQSVSDQPGVRPPEPSLIVGAQPHLHAPSPVAAPPVEPSAVGAVGAAATFFGEDTVESPQSGPGPSDVGPSFGHPGQIAGGVAAAGAATLAYSSMASTSAHGASSQQPMPSGVPSAPPSHSYSAPVVPTLGAAAAGAALGYMAGHQGSHGRPSRPSSQSNANPVYIPASPHHTPSKPGKHSAAANTSLIAAGSVAAVAGSVISSHHHSGQQTENYTSAAPAYPSAAMSHQHRHRGPLGKFVDFWKDPQAVGEFEEYTEYIGVCRHCFEPGSSPRDAPRKHRSRRRRSGDRYGSSTRIDKESRYYSSDGSSGKGRDKSSWVAAGLTTYGLGKVGTSLFGQNDVYGNGRGGRKGHARNSSLSVAEQTNGHSAQHSAHRTQRLSRPSRSRSRSRSRRRRHSGDTVKTTGHVISRRRHSKSPSRGRNDGVLAAAAGAAVLSATVNGHHQHRSRSTSRRRRQTRTQIGTRESDVMVRHETSLTGSRSRHHDRSSHAHASNTGREHARRSPAQDPIRASSIERKHRKRSKKPRKGFFNFGNSSASSSSSDAEQTVRYDRRSSKPSKAKGKSNKEDEALILGLTSAAALYAASQHSKPGKSKRVTDVPGSNGSQRRHQDAKKVPGHSHEPIQPSALSSYEEGWESASDGESLYSDPSALAFGSFYQHGKSRRRQSQESLGSEGSSGTEKWGWRWGDKREKRKQDALHPKTTAPHQTHISDIPAGGIIGSAAEFRIPTGRPGSMNQTAHDAAPLQQVYPVSTSDPHKFETRQQTYSLPPQTEPLRDFRPVPVPLQHPQPQASVSSAIYSNEAPVQRFYTAPSGPPLLFEVAPRSTVTHQDLHIEPTIGPAPYNQHSPANGGASRASEMDLHRAPLPRRRNSSPVSIRKDRDEPLTRRRASTRDQMSALEMKAIAEELGDNSTKARRDSERLQKREEARRERAKRREAEEQVGLQRAQARARRDSQKGQKEENLQRVPIVNESHPKDSNSTSKVNEVAVRESMAPRSSSLTKSKDVGHPQPRQMPGSMADDRPIYDSREDDQSRRQVQTVESTDSPRRAEPAAFRSTDGDDDHITSILDKYNEADLPMSAYFVLPELMNRSGDRSESKERVREEHESGVIPEVITIAPPGAEESKQDDLPPPSPLNGEPDPRFMPFPWLVPRLRLVAPTPPASFAGSVTGGRSASPSPVAESRHKKSESTDSEGPPRVESAIAPENTNVNESAIESSTRIRDTEGDTDPSSERQRGRRTSPREESRPVNLPDANVEPETPHVPGEFKDDIDFAATVAAGLEDTGFDPSIVVDDASFRRRNSPPGSEAPGTYQAPVLKSLMQTVRSITGSAKVRFTRPRQDPT